MARSGRDYAPLRPPVGGCVWIANWLDSTPLFCVIIGGVVASSWNGRRSGCAVLLASHLSVCLSACTTEEMCALHPCGVAGMRFFFVIMATLTTGNNNKALVIVPETRFIQIIVVIVV
ncbi:hypothetical protein BRADI_2g50304v3 [Brachypodium distachyon]|uniref:Uncharacterized protein n=1 Tax=Brachypodium distachyon TaxID=15368 RepID=A0A2K2DF11_BRADI|nr:hypothetical protein BRADI_2g50304v3 [Brachypodium distachyon]